MGQRGRQARPTGTRLRPPRLRAQRAPTALPAHQCRRARRRRRAARCPRRGTGDRRRAQLRRHRRDRPRAALPRPRASARPARARRRASSRRRSPPGWLRSPTGSARQRRGKASTRRAGAGLGGAGTDAWRSPPDEIRQMLTSNGGAILAEIAGEWWLQADAAALANIRQPAPLVAAADPPPEFHEPLEALAHALPRTSRCATTRRHHRRARRRRAHLGVDRLIQSAARRTRGGARSTARTRARAGSGRAGAGSCAGTGAATGSGARRRHGSCS